MRATVLLAILAVASLTEAAIVTNKTYVWDNSTGDIITNLSITATPPLFQINSGYFVDSGTFCVYQVVTNTISTSISTNITWGPGNIYTGRANATITSNLISQVKQGYHTVNAISTNTVSYRSCTNYVYGPGDIYTNQVCDTLSSNFLRSSTVRITNPISTTNKAAAVSAY